jgi:hypothetical protein
VVPGGKVIYTHSPVFLFIPSFLFPTCYFIRKNLCFFHFQSVFSSNEDFLKNRMRDLEDSFDFWRTVNEKREKLWDGATSSLITSVVLEDPFRVQFVRNILQLAIR